MSEKLGVVNENSGAAFGESNGRLRGGLFDGSESKTLAENRSDKVGLGDRVRVPEESKVLGGESTSGSGWKVFESGSVEIRDRHDGSKNRVVEMMSRNNGWGSRGVMDLVGRVLDGKLCMDKEVEDVNYSKNDYEVKLVSDTNAWQSVIGEPVSTIGIDDKGTEIERYSDNMNLSSGAKGNGLNGNQNLVSNEIVPDGELETGEVNNSKADILAPKECGAYLTEKEGEYYVSDLVWGKVRSHPWWPGQIVEPSAASDKAKRYYKRDSYLIAYFGDQTFAWNEESKIKPFQMHFSQMEKQSNADGFCHAVASALDEVARRVQLGLSCSCLPQEVHDMVKSQLLVNAGIREESSRRAGGDNLYGVDSFLPGELVHFLETVAQSPQCQTDRLQFGITKAQLLAFNRWKGHYQLPILEECDGFLKDCSQFEVKGEGEDLLEVMEGLLPGPDLEIGDKLLSKKRKSTTRDVTSWKSIQLSSDEECPKEKYLSVLMSSSNSSIQNDETKHVKIRGRKTISAGKNCETVSSVPSNSKVKRRKSGKKCQEATPRTGGSGTLSNDSAGKSLRLEIIPSEIPTSDVILSKLLFAAADPLQGHEHMISVVGFLRELRNIICLEKCCSGNTKQDAGKHKGRQPSNLETMDTFGFEGTEDSYWTDRIIQSCSQDHEFFGPKNASERATELEANATLVLNLDNSKERETIIVDLDAESPSAPVNEVSEEHFPTALILNFSNLESIPSVANLNEIFSRYGPLKESDTEVLTKSKRAKVIFKRRADAETAFSSTGKYSIFGPSLVSYRLNYAPTPRKSRATLKQSKRTCL